MAQSSYIHGTDAAEQDRLARLGTMTDESFLGFLDLGRAHSILEVGSGLGNLTRQVAARDPAAQVWGIEQSPEQLARCGDDLSNLHFRQGDAHRLPFEEGYFDVVYCRYVLEHVTDPLGVLQQMRRVLRAGGKVFIQENNILVSVLEPECPCFDAVWRKFAQLQAMLGGDALIGKRLLRLMQTAGFTDIQLSIQPEVHYSGSPWFQAWMENLIGNLQGAEQALGQNGLVSHGQVQQAIAELRAFVRRDDASSFFYWNRARGTRGSVCRDDTGSS